MQEYLKKIDEVIANGKFKDNWESLQQYEAPKWYCDAKFGIFMHWGVFTVPAYNNEWYSRNMYIEGSDEYKHHIETYGPHKDFGYKDFVPMYKAEKFNPEEWSDLFKRAGAQYIVPVAEHHDGFQMYDSELSDWNAAKKGPKRNMLKELMEACNKKGMVTGASNHRVEHWWFMGPGRNFDSDIKDPLKRGDLYWPSVYAKEIEEEWHLLHTNPGPNQEFMEDWLCRVCELVDKYRPKVIYFDWFIQHENVKPYLKKFAAYYYNRAIEWGEEVVITYKHDGFAFGTAVLDVERGQLKDAKPYIWQTDTAVAKNSWCYTPMNEYKTSTQIIQDLVDIVSKNGRLLLNIGPKSDGTIPPEDTRILEEIGEWLKVNGEAIYGSKVWRTAAEGPTIINEGQFGDSEARGYTSEDIRFTVNGSAVYATCLNMKGKDTVSIKSLREMSEDEALSKPLFHGIVRKVEVLGIDDNPEFSRDNESLTIKTKMIETDNPVVFKITVD
ncbi:MAG: alpha-L-fucosidase [Lachnospiraceae bacterium]|nr:alpha-L-fucosidase [Lachnospiraceae bacterium]